MMRKCEFCNNEIPEMRKKSAIYCSNLCKTKAHRLRNGICEPFEKVNTFQPCKSFTCCENARFYSPAMYHGRILKCDICGATWERK